MLAPRLVCLHCGTVPDGVWPYQLCACMRCMAEESISRYLECGTGSMWWGLRGQICDGSASGEPFIEGLGFGCRLWLDRKQLFTGAPHILVC